MRGVHIYPHIERCRDIVSERDRERDSLMETEIDEEKEGWRYSENGRDT